MKKAVLFLTLTTLLTAGCTHTYYLPNLQNVPLFQKTGDNSIILSSGSGLDDGSTLFDVQAAYALTDHLALTGSYFANELESNSEPETDFAKGSQFEIGGGFYNPFGDIGTFNILGGYGLGKQRHQYNRTEYDYTDFYYSSDPIVETGSANIHYSKLFTQAAVGLTTKIVDFAVSARFSRISYNDVDNRIEGGGEEFIAVNQLANRTFWWIEPALTLRLGYSPIKLQLQLALNAPLQDTNPASPMYCMNLGIVFSIPDFKKP